MLVRMIRRQAFLCFSVDEMHVGMLNVPWIGNETCIRRHNDLVLLNTVDLFSRLLL